MKSFRSEKHRKVLNDLTAIENTKNYERFDKKPKLHKDNPSVSHKKNQSQSHVPSSSKTRLSNPSSGQIPIHSDIEFDQTHVISDTFKSEDHKNADVGSSKAPLRDADIDIDIEDEDYNPEVDDIDISDFEDIDEDEDEDDEFNDNNMSQQKQQPLQLQDVCERTNEDQENKDPHHYKHRSDVEHRIQSESEGISKQTETAPEVASARGQEQIESESQTSASASASTSAAANVAAKSIIDKHFPMEPIWNKSIYNELQFIMKKHSSKTLDENDEDTFDVTMVAEYSPEIFNYMHELEHKLVPDPNYMDKQDELKWEMRSVLIDWVVQVHSRFNLLPETLFLTVNYIDRFLSKRKVSLSRFQLVGAVALFIAAKYEEINCPTIQEVAYMADNAYSIDDFLKAERFMIDVLEFDMGWPGPMSFLRRTSKADDYDYETRTLAKYFLEITIMDSKFVASQPSWLAAGAHYLSRKLLNKGSWSELHIFYSGYTELQLKPLAEVLIKLCEKPDVHHKAIFEKYQERRYKKSSTFVQEFLNQ